MTEDSISYETAQQRRDHDYAEWRRMFPDDSFSSFTYAYEAGMRAAVPSPSASLPAPEETDDDYCDTCDDEGWIPNDEDEEPGNPWKPCPWCNKNASKPSPYTFVPEPAPEVEETAESLDPDIGAWANVLLAVEGLEEEVEARAADDDATYRILATTARMLRAAVNTCRSCGNPAPVHARDCAARPSPLREDIPASEKDEGDGETVYGLFPGGDPRRFSPDEESCTPEEIARWEAACAAANQAEAEGREIDYLAPGCLTLGDGSAWDGTGLGIGVYTYTPSPEPVEEARQDTPASPEEWVRAPHLDRWDERAWMLNTAGPKTRVVRIPEAVEQAISREATTSAQLSCLEATGCSAVLRAERAETRVQELEAALRWVRGETRADDEYVVEYIDRALTDRQTEPPPTEALTTPSEEK